MKLTRYVVPFLLLAGVASAQAQPIVKINSGSSATECDVTNPTDGAIFRLDTSGNVLITGTLSGQGCGGGGGTGGGNNGITFSPLSPSPFPLTTGSNSISVGTNTSVSYSAANAKSCNVTSSTGTPSPSGSGSCPAVTLSGTSCTGTTNCSATGTATAPAALSGPTSCAYTLTANCSNDTQSNIPSTASLTVTTTVTPPPPDTCPNLHTISNGSGVTWTQLTGFTQVIFGATESKQANATNYVSMWTQSGTGAWPGVGGLTTRATASPNQYFSEKFTVPSGLVADGTLNAKWILSGSGGHSNFSLAVSTCPGDFGQTGTAITASGCKLNQANSSNGLKVFVSSPSGSACTVLPGQTYYLNILPSASLPVNNVSTSDCTVAGTCIPWMGVFLGGNWP